MKDLGGNPPSDSGQPPLGAGGARFVRAFVGAIGRAADGLVFAPPPLATLAPSAWHKRPFLRVLGFGATPDTLGRALDPALPATIKGRPFRLSADDGALGLGEARLAGELLDLDGKFSLWAEIGSGRGVLATDLLSAGGLYYSWDAARGTLWFATHLGFLLTAAGQQPHYDPVGVAAMLAARAAIRGITPFRGVHRLGPAEYLWVEVAQDGGVTFARRSYAVVADELCRAPRRPVPLPALLEELGALLEESVTREAYGQGTALMLTGGLDSQCLGLALRRRPEIPVEAATYGAGSFADLRGGRRTAAALGLRHSFVPFSDWTFETYSDLIVAAGGGSIDLGTAAMLDGFSRLDERFTTTIIGLIGGALSGKRLRQPGRHDLPQLIYKTLTQSRLPLPALFAPEMAQLAASVEELRNALGVGTDYQKDLLTEIVVRQANWISTQFDAGELLRNVSYPFYSRHLMKFFLNLEFPLLRNAFLFKAWLDQERNRQVGKAALRPLQIGGYRANSRLEFVEKAMLKTVHALGWKNLVRPWAYDPVEVTRRSAPWLHRCLAIEEEEPRLAALCRDAIAHCLNGQYRELAIYGYGIPMILARHRLVGGAALPPGADR